MQANTATGVVVHTCRLPQALETPALSQAGLLHKPLEADVDAVAALEPTIDKPATAFFLPAGLI